MDAIRSYLLTVTGAALVCAVAQKIPIKGASSAVIKLLCAVFMTLTALSPLVNLELPRLEAVTGDIWSAAQDTASMGENLSRDAMAQIIKEQSEAYILDKAADLGVSLSVSVSVSTDALPVPERVWLQGSVSPYVKAELTDYMENQLGIDRKEQIWTQP